MTTTQQMNCTCRECGGALEWYEQPPMPPAIPARQCVTCENPDCDLYGVTLMDDGEYRTRELDLAAFRQAKVVMPKRSA